MAGVLAIIMALGGLWLVGQVIVTARRRAHPCCARCGYDVGGQEPGDAPRERCSECGADLRVWASIVTSRWRLRVGVWLAVLAAIVVVVVAVSHVDRRQRDVWLYVPAPVLVWTARMESTKVGASALREIERRLSRNDMSERGVRQVLRLVLPRGEDDESWRYRPAWRAAAYWAIARGSVPIEDVVEYRRRVFLSTLKLTLPAPGEAGGSVPYTVTSERPVSVGSARLGGREVRVTGEAIVQVGSPAIATGSIEIPADTPPGEYELTLIVGRRTLIKLAGRGRCNPPHKVSADWTAELRGTVVVE